MSGVKVDISWSPVHKDFFLLQKGELNLYQTEPLDGSQTQCCQSGGLKISDDTFASLLSTNSEHQYVKCTAWYPKPEPKNLVAVGLANGRVILTSFARHSSVDPHRLCGKEFVPKHQRQCSYLAWNPVESNLLAEGLEKHKQDSSVLIWDVYQQHRGHFDWVSSTNQRSSNSGSHDSMMIQKPLVEIGAGEMTLSLSWFSHEPQTFVTGMNNKFLRIFDLRDVSRPQYAAYTKAVFGVKVDPMSQHRLASFYDDHISIWDTRNFEKPMSTLSETKNILKIAWSPTRAGLLTCLCKDSPVVRLYDIQHSVVADEIEPSAAAERQISSPDNELISSFDWHPTRENRLLLVSPTATVSDVQIHERIALTWCTDIGVTWVSNRSLWQLLPDQVSPDAGNDISLQMQHRALRGYGVQKDLEVNAQIVSPDWELRNLWLLVKYMKSTVSKSDLPGVPVRLYPGIKSLLCDHGNPSQPGDTTATSLVETWQLQGLDRYKGTGGRRVYHSAERVKALELSGWTYSRETASSPLIDRLEKEKQFERAATVAVFTLKIGRAIEILNKGSDTDVADVNLSIVAMALSGYTDDRETMWRDVSRKISGTLKDAYLRAMFAFLTADSDAYDSIINDLDLEVSDRVAFACLYLPDNKLTDFIEKLTNQLVANGDLGGILLTGLSKACLGLLQNYVDRSADVQTASVLVLQAFPNSEISNDLRVRHWINSYRQLLDNWQLWHHRAEFDVYRQNCDSTSRGPPWVPPQVFVSCNFCGKSVSFNSLATRSRTFMFGGTAAHKPRVTSCPSCKKPLPRCALCLINLGTSAGTGGKPPHTKDSDPVDTERVAKFADWFTWCQTCRHGGHAEHMTQWYSEHSECPVTGCNCKCASLDSIPPCTLDNISQTAAHAS